MDCLGRIHNWGRGVDVDMLDRHWGGTSTGLSHHRWPIRTLILHQNPWTRFIDHDSKIPVPIADKNLSLGGCTFGAIDRLGRVVMSELRSALDQLKMLNPDSVTVGQLDAEIAEAIRGMQDLEVLVAEWVKTMADRGGHYDLGYSSATTYLADRGRMTPGRARQVVSRGNAREEAPYAFRAWSDGRISTDQARSLFAAAEAVPDFYGDAEPDLVEIVAGLDAVDTRKAIAYWRHAFDGPGEMGAEVAFARRGLNLSETMGGMTRVDGWLTRPTAEALRAGLEANTPPRNEADTRTPRQRRHDALDNLCRDWLDNGTSPSIGGEKPHIMVLTDLPALRGISGGLHESIDGEIVDVTMLRMIACDSSVTRILLGSESEVLDVGRRTRVWSTAQRRAIIARDRHCQGPGCRAKPKYCDIHHVDHWANGGTTSVENGKLLCRPCHTRQHVGEEHRRPPRT